MKKLISILLIFTFCITFFAGCDNKATENFDYSATYYADIVVKDYGVITLELDASNSPITVNHFVTLAKQGYYNGLTFHKIVDGSLIQGGAPKGKNTKFIFGEFEENGYPSKISHVRGVISMARDAGYNTADSEFFILQADDTTLDGKYASFGWVTSGMEIVDQMCADAKPTDGKGTILPEDQPVIETITIRKE